MREGGSREGGEGGRILRQCLGREKHVQVGRKRDVQTRRWGEVRRIKMEGTIMGSARRQAAEGESREFQGRCKVEGEGDGEGE